MGCGARSTGEPREERLTECDAVAPITEFVFPSVRPFVMLAERTFWEKTTAVHAFCCNNEVMESASPDIGTI